MRRVSFSIAPIGPPKMRKVDLSVPKLISQADQDTAEYEAWGRGSREEYIVWKYLVYTKRLKEDVDFVFQSSQFGGRRIFGGVVVDFFIPSMNMIWRVQGERFHMLLTVDRTHDDVSRFDLEGRGYTVIDLWVRDLLQRPRYVLDLAWRGQQVQSIEAV
jgi:very-short-patch-repair endonuclease